MTANPSCNTRPPCNTHLATPTHLVNIRASIDATSCESRTLTAPLSSEEALVVIVGRLPVSSSNMYCYEARAGMEVEVEVGVGMRSRGLARRASI